MNRKLGTFLSWILALGPSCWTVLAAGHPATHADHSPESDKPGNVSASSVHTHDPSRPGRPQPFCETALLDNSTDGSLGSSSPAGQTAAAPVANTWTTGLKQILLLRVTFTDDATEPGSLDDLNHMMEGVNAFYLENSYGLFSLQPTCTPILALPHPVQYYVDHPSHHLALRDDAAAAARSIGFAIEDYDLDIVLNTRLFGFRATINGRGCWLQGTSIDAAVHELGHNLGLGHANLWVGRGDTIIGSGRAVPYGNMFDAMADAVPNAWSQRHFNAAHKALLGWLPSNDVQKITASGTYRLYSFDVPTLDDSAVYALTIPQSADREYWLEARQKAVTNAWAQNGVLLYFGAWSESYGTSPLLDMTPNSHWADDSLDAPLLVGRTFSDTKAGVHITPLARHQTSSNSWTDVRVVLGQFLDNHAPVASLQSSAIETEIGTPIDLFVTAQDPEDSELAYSWEFGDGTFGGNSNRVRKTWSAPGEYLVRCWVSDMHGGATFAYQIIRVGEPRTFRISGRVTSQGKPVAGARVSITDSIVTYTDAHGDYIAVGMDAGQYQLHPGKGYHAFEPISCFLTVTNKDVTGMDFEATWTDQPNNPPYLMTYTPETDSTYSPHATVPLRVWAFDDGLVQMVQFAAPSGLAVMGLGNVYTETWTNVWANIPPGEHVITAQAMDEFGAIGASFPAHIKVQPQPARFTSLRRAPDGGMTLTLTGDPGQVLEIQASANLKDWTPLSLQTNLTGTLDWIDQAAGQYPQRYYRARTVD